MEAIPLCLTLNKPYLWSLTQRRFSTHVKEQTELEYKGVRVCECVCVLYLCEKGNRQTDTNFKS
jgi:hypothetical protein